MRARGICDSELAAIAGDEVIDDLLCGGLPSIRQRPPHESYRRVTLAMGDINDTYDDYIMLLLGVRQQVRDARASLELELQRQQQLLQKCRIVAVAGRRVTGRGSRWKYPVLNLQKVSSPWLVMRMLMMVIVNIFKCSFVPTFQLYEYEPLTSQSVSKCGFFATKTYVMKLLWRTTHGSKVACRCMLDADKRHIYLKETRSLEAYSVPWYFHAKLNPKKLFWMCLYMEVCIIVSGETALPGHGLRLYVWRPTAVSWMHVCC